MFSDIVKWDNVPDTYVEDNDWTFEENRMLFVMKLPNPVKFTDVNIFPLTSFVHKIAFLIMKFTLYKIMNPIRIALGLKYL